MSGYTNVWRSEKNRGKSDVELCVVAEDILSLSASKKSPQSSECFGLVIQHVLDSHQKGFRGAVTFMGKTCVSGSVILGTDAVAYEQARKECIVLLQEKIQKVMEQIVRLPVDFERFEK